ncbi:MAG: hypothetical protein HC781_15440, partial [Leptolyngbyaceae cyanobacterium CSU_1_4]|nr:hypothetical protein [Leptolyngbyaceae cyanobacterium CSU_1_4]
KGFVENLRLEILSVALYVLAGSDKTNIASNESAFKYFLMGAFASGFLLFGIALIYGYTGTFSIENIARPEFFPMPITSVRECGFKSRFTHHHGWYYFDSDWSGFQNFGCPFPFLGSRCLHRRANTHNRLDVNGSKNGCNWCFFQIDVCWLGGKSRYFYRYFGGNDSFDASNWQCCGG